MAQWELIKVRGDRLPYRRNKSILSAAECAFYRALIVDLDSYYVICPKVNLADVFSLPRKKENRFHRYKISQKHVDFLICVKSTMEPVIGIELDDSSHDQKDRRERDQFVDEVYKGAGLPLLHVRATATYDSKMIASLVRDVVREKLVTKPVDAHVVDAPNCPKCGTKMVLRWAKKNRKRDAGFWGCKNFPACEETVKI